MIPKYSRHEVAGGAMKLALATVLVYGAACKSTVSPEEASASLERDQAASDAGPVESQAASASLGGGGSDDDEPKPSSDPATDPTPLPQVGAGECEALATDVQWILTDYCAGCHANGNTQGGFGAVLDVDKLIATGRVVPNDPDASKIYTFVKTGIMPRSPNKPTADEIQKLGQWIECGAPNWVTPDPDNEFSFLGINQRLDLINDDLRQFENPTDRERMRYIDFSHLSNAGATKREVDAYRKATSLLLNSLSYGNIVVNAEAIDDQDLLYRIDLRDYAWDADTWELIVADYPYAVSYDENSRLFPYDEDTAEEIREDTGTRIPYLQADWFLAHASQPPLYYDVLQIPEDINRLALDQGVNVERDIDDAQVARAGFNNSGVSVNNRVIERHEMPGSAGAFWLSYDFAGSVDRQNIFANPVNFQQDGGEGFFNLPNGLQAYFILNKDFVRLDEAPTVIVVDPDSRTGAVQAGLSCMGGCHLQKGILFKDDKVRAHALATAANAAEIEATLELYPEVDDMNALMQWDVDRYTASLARTGFDLSDPKTIIRMVRRHEDVLTLDQVAATLGVPASRLAAALDASPQAFPPEIVALRNSDGTIYREVFDTLVGDIVTGMGLGEQLRSGFSSSSRDSSSSDSDSSSSDSSSGSSDSGSDSSSGSGSEYPRRRF